MTKKNEKLISEQSASVADGSGTLNIKAKSRKDLLSTKRLFSNSENKIPVICAEGTSNELNVGDSNI